MGPLAAATAGVCTGTLADNARIGRGTPAAISSNQQRTLRLPQANTITWACLQNGLSADCRAAELPWQGHRQPSQCGPDPPQQRNEEPEAYPRAAQPNSARRSTWLAGRRCSTSRACEASLVNVGAPEGNGPHLQRAWTHLQRLALSDRFTEGPKPLKQLRPYAFSRYSYLPPKTKRAEKSGINL